MNFFAPAWLVARERPGAASAPFSHDLAVPEPTERPLLGVGLAGRVCRRTR